MRPSASAAAAAAGILRRSTTLATNWRCRSSITDWKIARSCGVSARKGLPMSLCSADLIAVAARPTFCINPSALRLIMMTPMDPVTVVGCATIVSAASAM